MADITPSMSARDYLALAQAQTHKQTAKKSVKPPFFQTTNVADYLKSTELIASKPDKRKNKYNARRTCVGVEVFDSKKESQTFCDFTASMNAVDLKNRVVRLERSKRFLLVPAQGTERACHYVADFVVEYADGRVEVVDTKSIITRRNPLYVLKRKLMLDRHQIKIIEM